MKKTIITLALSLLILGVNGYAFAQNVGIGINNPLDKLHVNGATRTLGLNLIGNSAIETGVGIVGKEVNAGKIGYGLFTPNTLDVIGGGTTTLPRKIRFWAEGGSKFEGPINVSNINTFTGVATDNVNINANISISEYTKLGSSSLPIKTETFVILIGKEPNPYSGGTGNIASIRDFVVPIPIKNIINYTVFTAFTDDNPAQNTTLGPMENKYSGTGDNILFLKDGQTKFTSTWQGCYICDKGAKIILHITYTNSPLW